MGEVMPLTPEDVSNKRFTPVRLREGYDMGEVDRFLIQLKGGVVPVGADPGVIQEQRGFVDRVLERIRPRD